MLNIKIERIRRCDLLTRSFRPRVRQLLRSFVETIVFQSIQQSRIVQK